MPNPNNKIIIIFSGYNQRAVVAFLRTLLSLNLQYSIIAKDEFDPILSTTLANDNYVIRKKTELDLDDISECIQTIYTNTGYENSMIAPSTEALNRFMLKELLHFSKLNVLIPLVDYALYTKLSDKYSFSQTCLKYDILVPHEYSSTDPPILPCVAKPRQYSSVDQVNLTPVLLFNSTQLDEFSKQQDTTMYYFQEFVTGKSLYLLYYIYRNGEIVKFSQENFIQQPNGKSIVGAVSATYHLSGESIKYENLFMDQGFHGFIMIEVKKNKAGHFMIEANPRFWGPSQLFVDAGLNLFSAFLNDYGFTDKPRLNSREKKVKYFWFGGWLKTLRENKELTFHSADHSTFLLNLDDWLGCDVYKRSDTLEIFKKELL